MKGGGVPKRPPTVYFMLWLLFQGGHILKIFLTKIGIFVNGEQQTKLLNTWKQWRTFIFDFRQYEVNTWFARLLTQHHIITSALQAPIAVFCWSYFSLGSKDQHTTQSDPLFQLKRLITLMCLANKSYNGLVQLKRYITLTFWAEEIYHCELYAVRFL